MSRPTPFPTDATPFAAQAEIDSPLGPLTALATPRGLAGLWFDAQQHHPGDLDVPVDAQHPHIVAAREWLSAYWSKRRTPSLERLDWDGRANGADQRLIDFEDDAHTQGLGDSIAGGQP